MLDKLKGIEDRYEQIGNELLEIGANYQRAGELNKERVDLEPLYQKSREYRQAVKSYDEAKHILDNENDSELISLAKADMEDLAPKIELLEKQIKGLLVPKDPRDDKNVYVEIRAGAGGDEAAIFAADLFRMYTRYADDKKWKTGHVPAPHSRPVHRRTQDAHPAGYRRVQRVTGHLPLEQVRSWGGLIRINNDGTNY